METISLATPTTWFFVKIACLLGLLVYIAFAFVVVKQVKIMIETLDLGLEKTIRALATVHLFSAVVIFILALILL